MTSALLFLGGYPLRYLIAMGFAGIVGLTTFILVAKAFPDAMPNRVDTWMSRIDSFFNGEDSEEDGLADKRALGKIGLRLVGRWKREAWLDPKVDSSPVKGKLEVTNTAQIASFSPSARRKEALQSYSPSYLQETLQPFTNLELFFILNRHTYKLSLHCICTVLNLSENSFFIKPHI